MTQHAVPRATRHRRWLRGLWPDRNPLRRTADRVEAAVVAGLLAAFVIGAPAAALIAGHWSYAVALRAEHAQRSTWRQVPAVLRQVDRPGRDAAERRGFRAGPRQGRQHGAGMG